MFSYHLLSRKPRQLNANVRLCTDSKAMEASKSLNCPFTRDHLGDIGSFLKLALRCSRKLSLGNVNCLNLWNYEVIVSRA